MDPHEFTNEELKKWFGVCSVEEMLNVEYVLVNEDALKLPMVVGGVDIGIGE